MYQRVVRYECDSCHKIVEEPTDTGFKWRGRVPKDWLHVDGFTNSHSVFKLDLCEDCKKEVLEFTQTDNVEGG